MMQKHLVMTVRAHARCDFALILRTARPESENQHHEVIEPEAPPGAVHPRQVIVRPLAVGFAGERVSVVRSPEPAGGEVLLRVRSRADGVRLPTYEERKVVTVLFADLVGFTSRAEQMDPEDIRALLAVNTGRRW